MFNAFNIGFTAVVVTILFIVLNGLSITGLANFGYTRKFFIELITLSLCVNGGFCALVFYFMVSSLNKFVGA